MSNLFYFYFYYFIWSRGNDGLTEISLSKRNGMNNDFSAYWTSLPIRIFFTYKHPAKKSYAPIKTFFKQAAHFYVVTIIWNLSVFRTELQLDVEHMYTIYWIFATWRRDRSATWHVGWGLLILVTTLPSLWALHLAKLKIRYIWFVTWRLNRCSMWLCLWGSFILSHHHAKFEIDRPCESGDIMSFICHVTTW